MKHYFRFLESCGSIIHEACVCIDALVFTFTLGGRLGIGEVLQVPHYLIHEEEIHTHCEIFKYSYFFIFSIFFITCSYFQSVYICFIFFPWLTSPKPPKFQIIPSDHLIQLWCVPPTFHNPINHLMD